MLVILKEAFKHSFVGMVNVVITHLFHPLLQYNARDPQLKHEPKASALLGRVLILQ